MLGNDAWMRLSLVIAPAGSSGTLKSTRMNTRRPAISTSRIERAAISEAPLREEPDQVTHPAGKTPLVVVPCQDLDEVATQNLGHGGIDNRTAGIVHEVARHHRILRVAENAVHGAVGGSV